MVAPTCELTAQSDRMTLLALATPRSANPAVGEILIPPVNVNFGLRS